MKSLFSAVGLFAVAAAAEIFGCYNMFYLWLTLKRSPLWLLPIFSHLKTTTTN
jgi:drug/metabolite transporter superfamily protein YnfA